MANKIEVDIITRLEKAEKDLESFKKKALKDGEKIADGFSLDSVSDQFKDLRNSSLGGMADMLGGVKRIGVAAIALGATFYALKKAADLAFEGEKIRAIENQFNVLTDRAGVTGDVLKSAFERAADGMVDTTDILRSANKALLELGDSATQLPDLFMLARKGSQVFGGEVTDNFEKITQAIASGNARSLKSIGIFIDSDKALRDYARTMGVSVEHLSQFGKQQAILNAVLEKGQSAFQGVDLNATRSANAFQKLNIAMNNIGDSIKTIFEGVFGPTLSKMGEQLASLATKIDLRLKAGLGTDAEQAAAKVKLLSSSLDQLARDEQKIRDQMAKSGEDAFSQAALDNIRSMAKEQRGQLDLLKEETRLLESQKGVRAANNSEKKTGIDLEKFRMDQEKINGMLQGALSQRLALQAQHSQAVGLETDAQALREFAIEQNAQMRLTQLRQQFNSETLQNTTAFKNLEKEIIAQKNLEMIMADEKRLQSMQAINNGMFQSVTKTISMAAQALGASLVKGSKAFEGFGLALLGILGDIAIQTGTTLIGIGLGMEAVRASIFGMTGGPALFAGIALVALGGLLKALSGGGGESSAGSAASSSGASSDSGGGIGSSAAITEMGDPERATPQSQININVEGNIWDRRETGLALAEVIQETFGTNNIEFKTS